MTNHENSDVLYIILCNYSLRGLVIRAEESANTLDGALVRIAAGYLIIMTILGLGP